MKQVLEAQIIDHPPVEKHETRPDVVADSVRVAVTQILEWDSNHHGLWSARPTS